MREAEAVSGGGASILLYEDDDALSFEIVAAFEAEGHRVAVLDDEASLVAAIRAPCDQALILDRMVRGRDSLDLLAPLRAEGFGVPVVVISSLASVDDRIRGLKAGGDDYLIKPFAMAELVARVAALQRRAEIAPRTQRIVGPLVLDLVARRVTRAGRAIDLLPREFALLDYLMRHAGTVVTRAMLLEDVWHYRLTTHTNVVDVHIGNLRRKIDMQGEPRLITSVRGLGFRLENGGVA